MRADGDETNPRRSLVGSSSFANSTPTTKPTRTPKLLLTASAFCSRLQAPRRSKEHQDQKPTASCSSLSHATKARGRDDFVGDGKHEDENNNNNKPENDHMYHTEANEQDQHQPRRRHEKSPRMMSPPRWLNAISFESRARQATKIIAPTARQSKRIRPEASGNWSPPSTRLVVLLLMATAATCYCSLKTSTTPRQRENQGKPPGWTSQLAAANLAGVSRRNQPNGLSSSAASTTTTRRLRRAARSQTSSGGGARPRPTAKIQSEQTSSGRQHQPTASNETGELEAQHQLQQRSIKNVTAQNGQSVLLHCLVEPNESGELPEVSWFRGVGEPQLLTYDTTTIIKDERFLVRQGNSRPNDWALQIKSLNRSSDADLYQCQTSGDTPQLQSYQLNVVEPQVDILGAPDLAVKLGAPINLTCVISQAADEMQFVFWYRDERMINYDFPQESRGKIVLSKWSQQRDSITSNLQIYRARFSDSGNYTCTPSGARSTSIYVHVLEASDKRLIMFQQDDSNPLAASPQHQTNSAISAHLIRLSRGRAYALLAGLFIFATWFQLIVQLQTLISLSLVATIGLLLGQTNKVSHSSGRSMTSATAGHLNDALPKKLKSQPDELPNASGKTNNKQATGGQQLHKPSHWDFGSQEFDSSSALSHDDGLFELNHDKCQDPLLARATDVLNLLRTLTDESERLEGKSPSCSSRSEFDDNEEEVKELRKGERAGQHQTTSLRCKQKIRQTKRIIISGHSNNQKRELRVSGELRHQMSRPDAASACQTCPSSSSTASTGYNSDSHVGAGQSSSSSSRTRTTPCAKSSTKIMPSVSLLEESARGEHGQLGNETMDELGIIELLRGRPTAMHLIIEHLQQSGQFQEEPTELPRDTRENLTGGACPYKNDKSGKPDVIYSVPSVGAHSSLILDETTERLEGSSSATFEHRN